MSRLESKNEKVSRILRYLFSLVMAILIYVAVAFGTRERRRVSIRLMVIPSAHYTPNSNVDESVNIDIFGNSDIIYNINPDKIKAQINYSVVDKEGIYDIPVELSYDMGLLEGREVDIISTKPTIRISFVKR